MTFPITVPRLGWSMEEGSFVGWLKQDGQFVNAGEPLFALESEKSTQDVDATDSGTLRLGPDSPKPGDVVKVGQVIGVLSGGEANAAKETADTGTSRSGPGPGASVVSDVPASGADAAFSKVDPGIHGDASAAGGPRSSAAAPSRRAVAISPRARRRAAELGVNALAVSGSGRTGRIVEADVVRFAQQHSDSVEAQRSRPTPAVAPAMPSTMRRLIAERTAKSFASIPHFYLRREVDATALLLARNEWLPRIEREAGVRLTLTDLLLRAQAMALRDFPAANCVWAEDRLVRMSGCDVGLVVGVQDGLMVPVVRGAHEGGLTETAKQRAALVESARAGRLTQDAMRGGASSLSNLGNSAVDEFAAVILPGQSSMLAVGRAASRPFVANETLVVRTTLKLCLSVDHRVMDGGPAAEFLGRIVDRLESPGDLA